MPINHTPNYNLNQWEPSDRVLRTDFNADNAKIDAGLMALSASKADASALEAEIAARTAADAALNSTVSGHTASLAKLGNCQIETFSYTGTGGSGSTRTVVNFPRVPVFVILMDQSGCFIMTRPGLTSGYYHGASDPVHFQWSGATLSFNSDSDQHQMNSKGGIYWVFAFYAQDT